MAEREFRATRRQTGTFDVIAGQKNRLPGPVDSECDALLASLGMTQGDAPLGHHGEPWFSRMSAW